MIIYHQNHIAAFTGAHIWYWFNQSFLYPIISKRVVSVGTNRLLLIHPPRYGGEL